eukprot:COSAG02_NODE_15483_length_1166_cov_15.753515_1_plen_55_part_10
MVSSFQIKVRIIRVFVCSGNTILLYVSHDLRLPKKIFVKIFRAVHRWKAERETVP